MSTELWVAIGTAALAAWATLGAVWKIGFSLGEIRIGVKELLTRDERTSRRVDSIETRVNDHTTRIARLEGREEQRG